MKGILLAGIKEICIIATAKDQPLYSKKSQPKLYQIML